jgi:hypothetical protein
VERVHHFSCREGNIVWRFSRLEHIADPGQELRWYAR